MTIAKFLTSYGFITLILAGLSVGFAQNAGMQIDGMYSDITKTIDAAFTEAGIDISGR